MTDQVDPTQLLDQIGFGFTKDGKIVDLQFQRKNGKTAYVPCEYGHLATVVLRIEQAAAQAYEIQKQAHGGADPLVFGPVTTSAVDSMKGGHSHDGKPVINFVLKSGMQLALAVPGDDIPGLISWLEALQTSPQTTKPRGH